MKHHSNLLHLTIYPILDQAYKLSQKHPSRSNPICYTFYHHNKYTNCLLFSSLMRSIDCVTSKHNLQNCYRVPILN
jgi:hypothetical protein